jgi:hypothetical protein
MGPIRPTGSRGNGRIAKQSIYPRWLNFGSYGEYYLSDPSQTTSYGTTGSLDDFADSFTVEVMDLAHRTPPKDQRVSDTRKMIINTWINLTK